MTDKKKDENIHNENIGFTLDQIRGLHRILDVRIGIIANYSAFYGCFVAYEINECEDNEDQ